MRLFGKNPVMERLRSNPQSIKKVHIQQGLSDVGHIRKKAGQHGVLVISVPKSKMDKITRHINAQGVVADVDDFEYMPYADVLEQARKKKRTLVFLDGVTDPQNLGAIIRSVGCLGYFSLVLPTHKSVSVTEAVLRVASGCDSHVPIAQVPNTAKAMKQAQDEGFHIVGTVVSGGKPLGEVDLPFPLGIVVGSEQKGISDVVRKKLDVEVTIPMYIDRLSFNVAHATAILCYEITRQRIQKTKKS